MTILPELKQALKELNDIPSLYLVTTDENYNIYEELKSITDQLDITLNHLDCINMSYEQILKEVSFLNIDTSCGGIYFSKLASRLKQFSAVLYSMIKPEKDIGAVNLVNSGLMNYHEQLIFPPMVSAVIKWIENDNVLNGDDIHVTIVNRSPRFGIPLADAFLEKNCTVTICHSFSKNLRKYLKNADIVISAAGQLHLIKPNMLKKTAYIIDLGNMITMQGDATVDLHMPYISPQKIHTLILEYIIYNFIRLQKFNN